MMRGYANARAFIVTVLSATVGAVDIIDLDTFVKAGTTCAGISTSCEDVKSCTTVGVGPCTDDNKTRPTEYIQVQYVGFTVVDMDKYLDCADPHDCTSMTMIEHNSEEPFYNDFGSTDHDDPNSYSSGGSWYYTMTGSVMGDEKAGAYLGISSYLNRALEYDVVMKQNTFYLWSPGVSRTPVERGSSPIGAPISVDACITEGDCADDSTMPRLFEPEQYKFSVVLHTFGENLADALKPGGAADVPASAEHAGVRVLYTGLGNEDNVTLSFNGDPNLKLSDHPTVTSVDLYFPTTGDDFRFTMPEIYTYGSLKSVDTSGNNTSGNNASAQFVYEGADNMTIKASPVPGEENSFYLDYMFKLKHANAPGKLLVFDPRAGGGWGTLQSYGNQAAGAGGNIAGNVANKAKDAGKKTVGAFKDVADVAVDAAKKTSNALGNMKVNKDMWKGVTDKALIDKYVKMPQAALQLIGGALQVAKIPNFGAVLDAAKDLAEKVKDLAMDLADLLDKLFPYDPCAILDELGLEKDLGSALIFPCATEFYRGASQAGGEYWMSGISDSIPFNRMYLPGTHDTASTSFDNGVFAQCQHISLKQQLNMGIRLLDVRVAVTVNGLELAHGPVKMPGEGKFADLLQTAADFVKANPSEFVVAFIKRECKVEMPDVFIPGLDLPQFPFVACLESAKDSSYFTDIVTQAAGTIQPSNLISWGKLHASTTKWPTKGDLKGQVHLVFQEGYDNNPYSQTKWAARMEEQNKWEAETPESKGNAVTEFIKRPRNPKMWYVNYASHSFSVHKGCPDPMECFKKTVAGYAYQMNDVVYNLLDKSSLKDGLTGNGAYFMDFPGGALVKRIYKLNEKIPVGYPAEPFFNPLDPLVTYETSGCGARGPNARVRPDACQSEELEKISEYSVPVSGPDAGMKIMGCEYRYYAQYKCKDDPPPDARPAMIEPPGPIMCMGNYVKGADGLCKLKDSTNGQGSSTNGQGNSTNGQGNSTNLLFGGNRSDFVETKPATPAPAPQAKKKTLAYPQKGVALPIQSGPAGPVPSELLRAQDEDTGTSGKKDEGLSAGAIAGIVVGAVVVTALIIFGGFMMMKKSTTKDVTVTTKDVEVKAASTSSTAGVKTDNV